MPRAFSSGRSTGLFVFLTAALPLLTGLSHAQVQQVPPLTQAYAQPVPTATITVDQSGAGNYTTIGDAVLNAPTGALIRVKAGTYHEFGIDFGFKQLVLTSVDGPGAAIIDAQTPVPPLSIFRMANFQNANTIIDGFEFRNGRNGRGGAIYCFGTSPKIINNIFKDNSAAYGGAIYAQDGAPMIAGNTFDHNGFGQASGSSGPDGAEGGALCLINSFSIVKDNWIKGNRAGISGGGIFLATSSHITLTNNLIEDNHVQSPGVPGTSMDGGGMAVTTGSAVTATHNSFIGNTAVRTGGGVWLSGPSNFATSIDNTLFRANVAMVSDGGGLMCDNASGTFTGNTFELNECDNYGGGVCCSGAGSAIFTSNLVKENVAWTSGGGIACVFDANAEILLCDIQDNDVKGGPGVGSGAGIFVESASVTIRRNTITGNGRNATGLGVPCWRGGGIDYVGGFRGLSQGRIEANLILANEITSGPSSSGRGAGVAMKRMGPASLFSSNVVAKNLAHSFFTTHCFGAGLLVDDVSPFGAFRINNNTIAQNTNGSAVGGFGRGGGILFMNITKQFAVDNCIVWANFAQSDAVIDSIGVAPLPRVSYTDVSSNGPVTGGWVPVAPMFFNIDPQFVAPSTLNYHIQNGSPLIGVGNNAVIGVAVDIDMDGAPRINGSIVDVGADEI